MPSEFQPEKLSQAHELNNANEEKRADDLLHPGIESNPEPMTLPPPIPPLPILEGAAPRSVPAWRHIMALVILLGFMVFVALAGSFARNLPKGQSEPMLPSTAPALISLSLLELGMFGIIWGIAWLFSRPSTDELFLRWRGTWQNVVLGLGYSLALRFVPVIAVVFLAIFALLNGVKPDELKEYIKGFSPTPDKLVSLKALENDPVYRVIMVTWMSFIVAGLREELWRVAVIASFTKWLTPHYSQRGIRIFAVIISSLFFGLAHWIQGPLAIGLTALIGMALGAITLAHRSIWPAVIAHGAFDALSFLLLPLAKDIKM